MRSTPTEAQAAQRRAQLLLAASRHPLAPGVASALAACGAHAHGPLAVLCSGGGDSMAMLILIAAIRERTDPTLDSLGMLTVDHGLREGSATECESALELARLLGISRRQMVRVNVSPEGNILANARDARLAAARAFMDAHGFRAALVAHTADDQAESLLLGLRRGVGLAAAARLRPVREFPRLMLPTMLRPLLGVRRADLRDFLRELGVAWHEDPSNALHDRGRLRAAPGIATLIDEIAAGASRLAAETAELVAWRDDEVAKALGGNARAIGRREIEALPAPLARGAITTLVRNAGAEPRSDVVEQAVRALRAGGHELLRFDCGSGVELRVSSREVSVHSLR